MKKLILFDWGNVLLNSNSNIYSIFDARKDIALELKPKNIQKFMNIFNDNKFWTVKGELLDALIQKYLMESECHCTIHEFKQCYLKYYRKVLWFDDMIALIKILSFDNRLQIGILSTLCEMDYELLKENLPISKFDYCFFSFNLGVQKPDSRIYNIVEIASGNPRKDILFIDDRSDNIQEAKNREWNTMLATGNDFKKIYQRCSNFVED